MITSAGVASITLIYLLIRRKKTDLKAEPTYFYPVLHPNMRLQVLNVNGRGYDPTVLDEIENSFNRLKGLAPYYQTNYKDLMYLQLHLDNGRKLEEFGISENIYKELIDRVDDFFMDKLAFGVEPKDGKRYYLPASLEDRLIGYH